MAFVVGVDIGGTFTDAFASDEQGRVVSAKSPSTPPDYSQGMIDVLWQLAAAAGKDLPGLLKETKYICHGTTSSLNALVIGDVAQVGFLTTRGYADSIYIMNLEGRYVGMGAEYIQNMARTNKPAPLLPRQWVREIDERMDYKGAEIGFSSGSCG